MSDSERYEQLAKKAAYQVIKAFRLFKDEPEDIRNRAPHIIMERVQAMINGENVIVEGNGLVTLVKEDEAGPINTPEQKGESPEAV